MNHWEIWEGFSARIRGLIDGAARLHATFLAIKASDSYGRGKVLASSFKRLREDLIAYQAGSGTDLPDAARTALQRFIDDTASLTNNAGNTAALREEGTQALLMMLAAFEPEMTFLLKDHQEILRSRADRAFEHLQRMIVVDDEFRGKWQAAFGHGEVTCEQRGGVHLLYHGIWAFKVDAAGGRTDLVYQEPINDVGQARRAADGLVLTEWKLDHGDGAAAFARARIQAELYRKGGLAGIEMTRYRYAVVVSKHPVSTPADMLIGNVTYRHINVVVDPQLPSREARKNA